MLLERTLNILIIAIWVLLAVIVVVYLINVTLHQGFFTAVRKLFSRVFFLIVFAAIAVTLLAQSPVFIDPHEVGVVVSLVASGGYQDRPLRSGLHWVIPVVEQVHRYPIYWQTYTMAAKPTEGQKTGNDAIIARTNDGQEVVLDCSVIFQIDADQVIRIHIDWQNRYIDDFIRPLVRTAVRDQVSKNNVDEVNSSKRPDLEKAISDYVRAALEDKGFIMDAFLLRNIAFTPEYAASVERKQMALQGVKEKEYQAEQTRKLAAGEADRTIQLAQSDAEATRIRAQAEADALKMIAEALAKEPQLITYRYVDKLSQNIRVMLVPNNSPFLLPLPDMETPSPTTPVTSTTPMSPTTPPVPTPAPASAAITSTLVLTP